MNKPQITLFRDFIEDGRKSMDIYADALGKALRICVDDRFDIIDYVPHTSDFRNKVLGKHRFRMRMERYLSYPLQARKHQSSVNHIIDHAYGHLLKCISPERSIINVHDLIPILAYNNKIPGLSYPNLPLLFKFSLSSLKAAKYVVAVSNSTKNDLVTYCGLAEEKIRVIHNGVDSRFILLPGAARNNLRRSFGFQEGAKVILITGSLSYKNHATSFQVIEILQQKVIIPIQLVILKGASNDLEADMTKYRFDNQVIILSGLDTHRLVELYNAVDCLLFPSWYEGFGWPPLEAMACGTPVVTSNVASLPEIVGDAGLMESPHDPIKLAEAVLVFLENNEFREMYIQRGIKRASLFTWERCAIEFGKLYDDILRSDLN